MLDSRERFAATADDYERYRPSYPGALVDWIVSTAGLTPTAKVADVGCGTGIAARLFSARGFDVVGVDPNEEMLEKARARGQARYVRGEASATGLPDSSVDLVVCAQAFHWFDAKAAAAEFRRILAPGGWSAAFWNVRQKTGLMAEYEALLQRIGDYRAAPKPAEAIVRIEALAASPGFLAAEFEYSQPMSLEQLLGRARSSSYVAHGVADLAAFEASLAGLFARHAQSGVVAFSYRTVVRMWR